MWGVRGRGREKVGVYLIDKDLICKAIFIERQKEISFLIVSAPVLVARSGL